MVSCSCAHHAREHGDEIREIAANVVGRDHKLSDTGRRPDGTLTGARRLREALTAGPGLCVPATDSCWF